jgi:hypothetical protein
MKECKERRRQSRLRDRSAGRTLGRIRRPHLSFRLSGHSRPGFIADQKRSAIAYRSSVLINSESTTNFAYAMSLIL